MSIESKSILENTFPAENQVNDSQRVTGEATGKNGLKVLFLGNSITWVPPVPHHDWHNSCGMAASAPEKDYLHLVMSRVKERCPESGHCIAQLASWERNYWDREFLEGKYSEALEYDADVIIVRIGENVPVQELKNHSFFDAYRDMINYFNPNGDKKVIVTTSFWYAGSRDKIMCDVAEDLKVPLVRLGDLGEDPEMKAIGLFEHTGVAAHPGDKGMAAIAERIWAELSKLI